mmetsp:Transcript_24746/g.83173  ORF Transcript_24746/g.83173 Transcript_24746/m.83173 type:complete len:1079 (+) Transcript_24746:64-3300(+)
MRKSDLEALEALDALVENCGDSSRTFDSSCDVLQHRHSHGHSLPHRHLLPPCDLSKRSLDLETFMHDDETCDGPDAHRLAVAAIEARGLAALKALQVSLESKHADELRVQDARRLREIKMLEAKRLTDLAWLESKRLADVAALEMTLDRGRPGLSTALSRQLSRQQSWLPLSSLARQSSALSRQGSALVRQGSALPGALSKGALSRAAPVRRGFLPRKDSHTSPALPPRPLQRLAPLPLLKPAKRKWLSLPLPFGAARVAPLKREAARAHWPAEKNHLPRYRFGIALALVVLAGIAVACVFHVVRTTLERKSSDRNEKYDCQGVKDAVGDWGKRLNIEAATFGSLMKRERELGISPATPFLVPGPLASALQLERLTLMAAEFRQAPPGVVWYPTVMHQDREAYEAYVGQAYNFSFSVPITDEGSEVGFPLHSLVSAADRPSYNPVFGVFTAADPRGGGFPLKQLVGLDVQERDRRTLPAALYTKFFIDHRIVAHPWYSPDGTPTPDFLLTLRIPVVADGSDGAEVLGYVSFTLHADSWAATFPNNVEVLVASTGHVVKTVSGYEKHAHAHEPFLDLSLLCHYNVTFQAAPLYAGACVAVAGIFLVLWLWRRMELGAALIRRNLDERRKDNLRDAAALEQRRDERVRYGFEMSEKTERYLNHELKNRIFVLGQSCAEESLHVQIDEITEVLNSKAVLMRLSTGRYKPTQTAVDPVALIEKRRQRHLAANSPFERLKTTGTATCKDLMLDQVLFNIIVDNMLSNAFKYGDALKPPTLSVKIDAVEDRACLTLELRNWSGPEHAQLLSLGEDALNDIALAEGKRAHEHAAELSSGDGFPMAAAAALALGGTVRLLLLEDGVVAKLELPDLTISGAQKASAVSKAVPVELLELKMAMADDSATFRKTFARLAAKVTSRSPVLAGETRESIDGFSQAVVDSDCDVVLLDFNFAPVHHTKNGLDVCRECRALDAEEGNVPRVIFIVSANDSPDDAERYVAAGADGSLGKKLTAASLRAVLEDVVKVHPRFQRADQRRCATPKRKKSRTQTPWPAIRRDAARSAHAARHGTTPAADKHGVSPRHL